ncbi:transglutaminase family protein [Pseudooceanicola aestuarii]|uniref:transglutaminase family protein n=1 Tax=Pseudooceanicola aestuarii TaxID=2697319 RepID=UPI0013D73EFE|nr:transglutaminase family protein [Pseudooceanicola aestuarii]
MRYDIRLKIVQQYGAPTGAARLHLRLLPLSRPGAQTLGAHHLSASPAPSSRRDRWDFFGNAVSEMTWADPLEKLTFQLRAGVERQAPGGRLDFSPPLPRLEEELCTLRALGPQSPLHFTAPSPRVAPDAAITAFARACLHPGQTAAGAVTAIGAALYEAMTFDTGATDVATPPENAFAQRRGVCQDFSHVMIAALRAVGIPAGYVSGFLRTLPPEGAERLAGADAMHAWVRAWAGVETGWIEFDPTNNCPAGRDHVVVAFGRDYSDVAPVKGTLRTSGAQASRHSVDVLPLEA